MSESIVSGQCANVSASGLDAVATLCREASEVKVHVKLKVMATQ